jgi:hypothetical protein
MRRVVVTGIGTVNALAQDVPGTFAAFRDGRCGIGPLGFRDAERLTIRIGAEVRDWRAEDRFATKDLPLLDKVTQYALVAGAEAVLPHLVELRRHHDEPGAGETAAERLEPRVGGALMREAVRYDDGRAPVSAAIGHGVTLVGDDAPGARHRVRGHRHRRAGPGQPARPFPGHEFEREGRGAPAVAQALTHAPAAAGGSRARAPSRRPARIAQ